VPAVNRARVKFDQLGISGLVEVAGPFMLFYEQTDGQDVIVNVALPVAEEPAELPPPARYQLLPAIEAAAAVRSGPAASIYPMVYQDLVSWVDAHGYQRQGPGRDIWIHEVDDISEVEQQVFETQLAFTRPGTSV
jgi:effector-binding domain-containing protein